MLRTSAYLLGQVLLAASIAAEPAAEEEPMHQVDPSSTAPRVFLVDDHDGLRQSMCELLEDSGMRVVGQAGDGETALQLIPPAAATAPLVALVDVHMPGALNGIDVTRHLTASGVRVEAIVFTAYPEQGIKQAAKEAGALAFLVKGTTPAAVVTAVRDAWAAVLAWNRAGGRG